MTNETHPTDTEQTMDTDAKTAEWKARAEALRNRTPEETAAHGARFERRMARAFRTVGRDDDAARAERAAEKWETVR